MNLLTFLRISQIWNLDFLTRCRNTLRYFLKETSSETATRTQTKTYVANRLYTMREIFCPIKDWDSVEMLLELVSLKKVVFYSDLIHFYPSILSCTY